MGRDVLDGKVALVTGAGRGIGRAIALEYAAEGASVVVASRSAESVDAVVAQIASDGGTAVGVQCDVTRRDDVRHAVATAVQRFGGLHVLVNNAGGAIGKADLEDFPDELWDRVFCANVKSTLWAMQFAFVHLKQTGGTVINMGSMAGQHGYQRMAAYAAAKEALLGLSRTAAKEWGPHGINVVVINPAIESDGVRRSFESDPGRRAQLISHSALKRLGSPRECARVAVFLASEDAKYVTGVKLDVDGGRTIMHAMDVD